jgi:heme-degrading monooxygenase HmoA
MFCVVYRFDVIPGREHTFEGAWHELTAFIREQQGSLGSRLHRADGGAYVAYAQWPSRELFDAADGPRRGAEQAERAMRDSCSNIERVFEMEMLDDLLVGAATAAGRPGGA